MFGPPGSGKGTQAAVLASRLGVPAISTGEMLRQAVAQGSDLGNKVETIMTSGALVDDETMAEVVRHRLAQKDTGNGFLLDGYPRTKGQARTLEQVLQDQDVHLDGVVFLDVPTEELVTRALARKRADDREEVIRERLRIYHSQTAPLLGYYRDLGLLRTVDGHQSIDKVTEAVLASLAEAA
ncbi:MAG: adenylate kinase [Thermoanaerobaculia bacterium]|nr:adenylate kinase [Thermoanaerobaculia bacterium]